MTNKKNIAMVGLIVAAASGCTTANDYSNRPEAVSLGAGNAQAANTVMQMVDPWPVGVDDTNIKTPSKLDQYKPDDADDEAADGVATSDLSS